MLTGAAELISVNIEKEVDSVGNVLKGSFQAWFNREPRPGNTFYNSAFL